MSSIAKFHVLVPAMRPPAGAETAPMPDNTPVYAGTLNANNPAPVVTIGAAQVKKGQQVGNIIYGCTYTAGVHVIPGFGNIEVIPLGQPAVAQPKMANKR